MPIDAKDIVPSLWDVLSRPSPSNTWLLGSSTLSWSNLFLGPNNAPVLDIVSGNIGYYARTAAELAAGVTPLDYGYPYLDLRRYYSGSGAYDTAIASAISALNGIGGTITIPAGVLSFANQIDLHQKKGIIFQGVSSLSQGAPGTQFLYTGSGAPFINMAGATGCQLKGISFNFNNAGFVGPFVQYGESPASVPAAQCAVLDCTFGSAFGNLFLLDCEKTIELRIERCQFSFSNPAIQMATAPSPTNYTNVIAIRDCVFQSGSQGSIKGCCEGAIIEGCAFEPLASGAAGAINMTADCHALDIIGNWFGDVTANGGTWITIQGEAINIIGNRIGGDNTTLGIAINLTKGGSIKGNSFNTLNNAISFAASGCTGFTITNNKFVTVTTPIAGMANHARNLVFNPNEPFISPLSTYNGNIASPGYEVSPQGIIRMWGGKTVTAGTPLAITFATEVGLTGGFPTALFNTYVSLQAPGVGATGAYTSSPSSTGVTLNVAGGTAASTVNWEAIGN
jgi:hypothetical protein